MAFVATFLLKIMSELDIIDTQSLDEGELYYDTEEAQENNGVLSDSIVNPEYEEDGGEIEPTVVSIAAFGIDSFFTEVTAPAKIANSCDFLEHLTALG